MIDPIFISIGPLTIYWYGFIIATAILMGLLIIIYLSKKEEIDTEFFIDLFIIIIPISLLGARLYYVIFNLDYYLKYPLKILAIWEGGLAIHGAIISGLIVLIIFTKKRNLSFLKIADILAPAVILGQAIGRWGNFINQEAFGTAVSENYINRFPEFIKNQMYIEGSYHHPTFLYESLWNLLVFIFLLFLSNGDYSKDGDVFFSYLIGYSLGRFFIEGMRTDSLMFLNIRVAQLSSIILIIFGTVMIIKRHWNFS